VQRYGCVAARRDGYFKRFPGNNRGQDVEELYQGGH